MQTPFFWGQGGQALTPDQVARQRALADALIRSGTDTSPVGHWSAGAARLVDALSGKLKERRADAAETAGMSGADSILSALLGGSGQAARSAGYDVPADTGPKSVGGAASRYIDDISGNSIGKSASGALSALGLGAPPGWDKIRDGIFAGESGGDYNALFGYSNRDGGQFANTRLTDMTVDQALAFADPSGPYGQWVNGKIGRVATPMGAYQVVGSTLRDAKAGLGLRGDERMTPELQDRIGQWIYKTQGTGAWEGYRGAPSGGSGAGGSGGASPALSALLEASGDPWVAQKYGPVLQALIGQQMQQSDPAYQIALQKAQLELEQMRNPAAPRPIEVGGVLLDPVTYQPIFDSRQNGSADPWANYRIVEGKVVGIGANGPEVAADFSGSANPDLTTFKAADGAMYSFDPRTGQTSRLVGGEAPKRETQVVGGRLIDSQTGDVIADFSDPNIQIANGQAVDMKTGKVIGDYRDNPDRMREIERAKAEGQASGSPADKPKPVEVGGVLLDPNTYQPIFDSRKPDGAQSQIGKLEEDLRAGRINQAQYEAGLAKLGGGTNVNVSTGTIPPGYRMIYDANGNPVELLEIPKVGGPDDTAARDAAKVDMAKSSSDTIMSAGVRALDAFNNRLVGGVAGSLAALSPGTESAEVYRQVDVLKANASVENINAMRAASPTGGALGQASDSDIKLLQAKSGALDPASKYFVRDLADYTRSLLRTVHGVGAGDDIFFREWPITVETVKQLDKETLQDMLAARGGVGGLPADVLQAIAERK